jgi:hypothetical protein
MTSSIITKKSAQRKSPMASATKHPVGKKMKGVDGNMWIVKATSSGVHRWVLVQKTSGSKIGSKVTKKTVMKTRAVAPGSKSKSGSRQSPIESATLFKPGKKMIGMNNKVWIVEKNSNGVHRWVLYKEQNDPIIMKQYKKIGSYLQETTSTIISDPCYEISQGKSAIKLSTVMNKVQPGKWIGCVKYYGGGGRVAQLLAFHQDYDPSRLQFKTGGGAPVDSGQMSIVDKSYFRNDDIVGNLPVWKKYRPMKRTGELWYSMCCNITLTKSAGIIPYGIVSNSGWGDGWYPLYYANNRTGHKVAFRISFIMDGEEELVKTMKGGSKRASKTGSKRGSKTGSKKGSKAGSKTGFKRGSKMGSKRRTKY